MKYARLEQILPYVSLFRAIVNLLSYRRKRILISYENNHLHYSIKKNASFLKYVFFFLLKDFSLNLDVEGVSFFLMASNLDKKSKELIPLL